MLPVALFVASLAYPIFVFLVFPNWVIDDAFITFRYAENLARFGQFTWNVGEAPVEGYTGVVLPAVLALFIKLGLDPINVSHAIGALSFFGGWLMLFWAQRSLKIHKLVAGFTMLLYSTTPILFTHASSGLETMLFIASILASMYFFLRFLNGGSAAPLFFSLLFTGLVRPEGVAWAALVILAAAYHQYKHKKDAFKFFIISFTVFYFLPALFYFLWRWDYYGALLPNTYYAKRGNGFSINVLADIFRFVRRFFAAPVLAGLILLMPEIDRVWPKIKDAWRERLSYVFWPAAAFAAVLIIFLSRSHLTTNFSTRFYTPLMPLFWIGSAYLINLGVLGFAQVKETKPLGYKLAMLLLAAVSIYQVSFQVAKIRDEMRFVDEEKLDKENMHYLAGKFLKENLSPSDWLAVYIDAGAIPYFSGMKTVDFGALNDPYLVRGDLSSNERVDYFFAKNPAAAVFTSTSLVKVIYTPESDAITEDPRFQNYVLAKKYPSPLNNIVSYHQLLFVRKDVFLRLKLENNQ